MMLDIILIIISFLASILIIKYRYKIYEFTGDIDFFESHFGGGATLKVIVFLAILQFFLVISYVFGTLSSVLKSTIGVFFGY